MFHWVFKSLGLWCARLIEFLVWDSVKFGDAVLLAVANDRLFEFFSRCSRATGEIDVETKCRTAATMPIEWFSWLSEVGMQKHGHLMVINHLEESDIVHFDHDLLRSIGVDSAKDRLLILNQKNKHIRRNKGNPAISRMFSKITAEAQSVIIDRVQTLHVDEVKLLLWTKTAWPLCTRKALQELGYLSPTATLPGTVLNKL